jgi:DNA-binding NtrC family response regulator
MTLPSDLEQCVARITVVNDYPEFLETMYAILDRMEGHEVAGFDGDETTIDDLVNSEPELLLVDLRIAGDDMKGWDILMLARAEESLRHVPLIVCSADIETLRERAAEFERIGNIFTLEKPFSIDEVTAVLDRALTNGSQRA